ncbi:hypothetical protein ACJJTC_008337 [Scirpophaga incertulas]
MAATGATMMPTTTTSYADKLRAKASTGPILAIYQVEGSTVKTSEELKTVVKSSTRTAEDLHKLKAALPNTVKAIEVKGKQPLVVIRDLEGKEPPMSETMVAVYEQNLRGDSNWTKEKVLANCRLAFRKSRMGSSQSVMVLACSPELRKTLVSKGRLYIGWESCRVARLHNGSLLSKVCPIWARRQKMSPGDYHVLAPWRAGAQGSRM